MAKNVAAFYSNRSEKFADKHSIDNVPESYVKLLSEFSDLVKTGKVLDAGCGPGRDVRYFAKKNLDVIGIDASEKMIKEARKRGDEKYQVMNVEELDFDNQKFDGVWCNTVLIFFKNKKREKILNELRRVLKPGGMIHLGLKEGSGTFLREINNESITQYLLSQAEARKFLEDNEFEILEIYVNETNQDFNFLNIFARKIE